MRRPSAHPTTAHDARRKSLWQLLLARREYSAHCHRPRRRTIQYSRDIRVSTRGGGVADAPLSRSMTAEYVAPAAAQPHYHSAAVSRCTLSAISFGTGAVHGALRRRLTSTSIQ